jgi:hypothetical protein
MLWRRIALGALGSVPLALLSIFLSSTLVLAQITPCWGGVNNGAWAALLTHTSTNGTQGDANSDSATPPRPVDDRHRPSLPNRNVER